MLVICEIGSSQTPTMDIRSERIALITGSVVMRYFLDFGVRADGASPPLRRDWRAVAQRGKCLAERATNARCGCRSRCCSWPWVRGRALCRFRHLFNGQPRRSRRLLRAFSRRSRRLRIANVRRSVERKRNNYPCRPVGNLVWIAPGTTQSATAANVRKKPEHLCS